MHVLNSALSLLLLTATLSACGSSTAPPKAVVAAPAPSEAIKAPLVPGQPQSEPPAPPAQAQVIESIQGLLSGEIQTLVTLNAGSQVLAAAQVETTGHFTLPLPTETTLSSILKPLRSGLLSELGCFGQLTTSDPAAQGYDVGTLHTPNATYMNATVSQTLLSRSLSGRVYLYADRSGSLTGTLDCRALTGLPTPVTVHLSLSKGWNVLGLTLNAGLSLEGLTMKGQLNNGSDPLTQTSTWTNQVAVKAQMAP